MVTQKKKKKRPLVPFRLNILFFAVFILFSMLILRLGIVQIVYGDDFKREIERTEDVTVKNPVPRGKMFDRNGKVIVDNTPLNAITYTKYQNTTQEEMLEVAEKLAGMIEKDTKKVQVRDKIDFWLMKHPEEAKKKITKKEWDLYENKELTDKELYKLQVDRVTEEEINSLTASELEVLAIFREFNSGYAQSAQIVKNEGVTPEEFAIVSENLEELPGVDTTTDWKRDYTQGDTLKTILGNVTTSDRGVPKEQLDYYLSRDYSRNDRVGISYIEKQYEEVLQGQKAKVKNKTDKGGNILGTEVISEGKRGKDLVLTIDMELQKAVEKILEDELKEAKRSGNTRLLDRGFVVLTNPYTGEILAMAGKKWEKNPATGKYEWSDYAYGTFATSYNVGSAVKGATVYTGFQEGVIRPGSVITDKPLYIKDTPVKASWRRSGFGPISDLRALQVSSNVYMFEIAIRLGNGHYVAHRPLPMDIKSFYKMRESFAQFGLGVRTGIDLPSESAGFTGALENGKQLDLAIGQYDTYTAMQLAQYVSTIANGGTRVQPHIVKEIREPIMESEELGPVIQEIQPKVLNKLDGKEEWLKRVQTGFKMVMQGDGTAARAFAGAKYRPAGKTGTAEAFYDGFERSRFGKIPPEVMNLSLVSYAPSDKPEVAMAVLIPWAYQGNSGHSANTKIGKKVLDTYFELQKKRASGENAENNTPKEGTAEEQAASGQ
ncbi:peptidoglycan D,D-transpeptidase FtsI family protein [Bacillus sp. B-jedd]|uniref:peptidoglycan D,D-transpeptidase FtsI family protein n=1 Tax=Bacillus sp. B-jedd TaxID=1476857 RepID=UPI0005155B0C|nr:penicillin-binding protein 2 [Bacillus sp. B-jedd]CEG27871.1 transpeptidase (penicillin-binding protein 2A) [Bacillus sp. B-jedd]